MFCSDAGKFFLHSHQINFILAACLFIVVVCFWLCFSYFHSNSLNSEFNSLFLIYCFESIFQILRPTIKQSTDRKSRDEFSMDLWTWVTERDFTTCFAFYKPFCDGQEY